MAFNEFFTEMILPFLLVFVVVFAILQKSKILGDGKAQIDAITSLVIGLILIGAPYSRNVVVNLMPWLAVGVAVMLVFFILYGFVAGDLSGGPKWMKLTFGPIIGLFVIIVVLYVTGLGNFIIDWFYSDSNKGVLLNFLMVVAVVVAMVVVVLGAKRSGSS